MQATCRPDEYLHITWNHQETEAHPDPTPYETRFDRALIHGLTRARLEVLAPALTPAQVARIMRAILHDEDSEDTN